MNDADRLRYRDRYVRRLEAYGHDPRTLGWGAGKQQERFAVLTSPVPLDRVGSILDVGCGFGDLHAFLRARGYRGRYTGLDFIPELIATGRATDPEADLRVGDVADLPAGERFDLVIASGIFNARLAHEDNWHHIRATLTTMFAAANHAVAADFLTSYVDFRRDDLYYTSPEDLLGFAKGLTRRVALMHQYMPFEFAIHLYKDDRVMEGARFPEVS